MTSEHRRTPVPVAIVVLSHRDRVLVRRRTNDPLLANLWEFPGGKLKPDERPEDAAARELLEETAIAAPPLRPLHETIHEYPDRTVHLHFYMADLDSPIDPCPTGAGTWQWLPQESLDDHNVPRANQEVLRILRESRTQG